MFTPLITAQPPFASYGENNSWIKIDHDIGSRPLYAQAVYNVNPNNSLGMNGFDWVATNGQTSVGPYVAILATTTSTGETHSNISSLTGIDGNVASNLIVLAGTYIYNVKAFTIGNNKTGIIAYK